MNVSPIDMAIGATTARMIADRVQHGIAKGGIGRTRARDGYYRRLAVGLTDRGETLRACRAARGLDPFCPRSDPESEQFRSLIEATRYMRALRADARRLMVAAVAAIGTENRAALLAAPLMVNYAGVRLAANAALTEMGFPVFAD